MLPVPVSDITKIAIVLGLLGAFILAKNYLPTSIDKVVLEGRLQFGGSSFEMRDKIVQKHNAWVGFILVIFSVILQWSALELDKFTTWGDLKGRTVLFGSPFNSIATIALFIILLRVSVFITDWGARREYFPYLKDREKPNFERASADINNSNKETAKDAKEEIDQLLLLFDVKVKKDSGYGDKIAKLQADVFKK